MPKSKERVEIDNNADFIVVQDKEHRKELGVVTYANNVLETRRPRKI